MCRLTRLLRRLALRYPGGPRPLTAPTRAAPAVLALCLAVSVPLSPLAAGPHTTSFLFVESAASHLGGDPFRIDSMRIDLDGGTAQLAHLRSDGVVVALLRAVSDLTLDPAALPHPPPRGPGPRGGPPPPSTEGMGPAGTVAHGDPGTGLVLRRFESDDPAQLEPLPALRDFMTEVARSVSDIRPVARGAMRFVQARPWGDVPPDRVHPDLRLTGAEVAASVVLRDVFEHPFQLVPLPHPGGASLGESFVRWLVPFPHPAGASPGESFVRSLAPGRAAIVGYAGGLFTLRVYRYDPEVLPSDGPSRCGPGGPRLRSCPPRALLGAAEGDT